MTIMVAPTEPTAMKALGKVSLAPEKFGLDVMWASKKLGGIVGIQRKEIKDLVASVQDGRLAKECGQMRRVAQAVLVVEGRPRWSTDGELMIDWAKWSRTAHRSLLRSIQMRGIWVEFTDDVADTVAVVLELRRWMEKENHYSLDRRPKPKGTWGVATDRDWASHLLQSVPGIGPGVAEKILDHFDGRVPMEWSVGREELLAVDGLGPVRVDRMIAALGQGETGEGEDDGDDDAG